MHKLLKTIILALLAGVATISSATILEFDTVLLGSSEVPPSGSPATGFADITIDTVSNQLDADVTFLGLTAPASASHIHCCTAPGTNVGVAVPFPGFPNTTSGTYDPPLMLNLLDPSIYTASFLTTFGGGTAAGAESALIAGLIAGQAYVNIHTSNFPGGEIRGFLVAQQVPEPATLALLGLGLAGLGFSRRRKSN